MSVGAPRTTGRADVLLAGGGTAGHVLPELAIAAALVRAGHEPSRVQFVGSSRGMEAALVPQAGFPITLLPGRGIVRRLAWQNVSAIAGLLAACVMALAAVRRSRPKAILAVGGYASVPPAFAGMCFRIPVVTLTLDAVPGAAIRLIGRFATKNAVVNEHVPLPRAEVTGVPVRSEVLSVDLSQAARHARRRTLGIEAGHKLVVITGGSLGAGRLNDAALGLVTYFADRGDLTLYHVAGARDVDRVQKIRSEQNIERSVIDYRLVSYEDRLFDVIASADLVISRAGASTVAELCVLGAPSILVPLPNSPANHQFHNAMLLAGKGAAVVVNDDDATASHLGPIVDSLFSEPALLSEMASAAHQLGVRDSADRIASMIDHLVGDAKETIGGAQ